MLGLTVHAALSERTIACSSLAVTTELVHVVSVVGAAVVWVVVWVARTVAVLRVLALSAMSLACHSSRVRGIVAAVLSVTVTALRLRMLLARDNRRIQNSA